MKTLNRREVLGAVAVVVPTIALAAAAEKQASAAPKDDRASGAVAGSAFAGKHQPAPLPFSPGKLTGISEKASTPTRSTTAQPPRSTSMRSSRTSTGTS